MKRVQTLQSKHQSPNGILLKDSTRPSTDNHSQDRWCILPTCLGPGSSLPESARRLSGSVLGPPLLLQSRCRPDTLPVLGVLLPAAARQQHADVIHCKSYAHYLKTLIRTSMKDNVSVKMIDKSITSDSSKGLHFPICCKAFLY